MSEADSANSKFCLTVDLPLPPALNAKEYNLWLNDARYKVITAWRDAGKPVVPEGVPMLLWLRFGSANRKQPASDCLKAVLDVLARELPISVEHTMVERNAAYAEFCRVTIAVMDVVEGGEWADTGPEVGL